MCEPAGEPGGGQPGQRSPRRSHRAPVAARLIRVRNLTVTPHRLGVDPPRLRLHRPRRPRILDHTRLVLDLPGGGEERGAQLRERPALTRARAQREVDGPPKLTREIPALAAQGRQVHRGAARRPGTDPRR